MPNKKETNKREEVNAIHYNSLSEEITVLSGRALGWGDSYADHYMSKGSIETSLEDKEAKSRECNTSVKLFDKVFVGNRYNGKENPFVDEVERLLNDSNQAKEWMETTGITNIANNKSGDGSGTVEKLLNHVKNGGGVKITDKISIPNAGELIGQYYLKSKDFPCHYIQKGDNFYRSTEENPFNLPDDIPLYQGSGKFGIRILLEPVKRQEYYKFLEENNIEKKGTKNTDRYKYPGQWKVRFLQDTTLDNGVLPESKY